MENKPTHYLYNVIDQTSEIDDEKRGIWTRIGAAWPHGDGKGFSITPDLPMMITRETRLVLRAYTEPPTSRQSETDDVIEEL